MYVVYWIDRATGRGYIFNGVDLTKKGFSPAESIWMIPGTIGVDDE